MAATPARQESQELFGSKWFHGKWSPSELEAARREKTLSMPYLELLTQTIIVQTWAHEWKGKNILLSCNCLAVVNVINNGRSRDIRMSELVRTISLSAMNASCDIKAIWIPGDINEPADSLSRFSLTPTQLSIQFGLLTCNQVTPLGRPSLPSDDMLSSLPTNSKSSVSTLLRQSLDLAVCTPTSRSTRLAPFCSLYQVPLLLPSAPQVCLFVT